MMDKQKIKIMSVMAHQDDFEFSSAGTFALLRNKYNERLDIKILALSRGASGHYSMNIEETFRRREREARKSASIIGGEYECMTCLDGSHIHAQVFIDRNVLGGLWNAIRKFKPDYIFCPPVIEDPLAGIHIDHFNVACAVRMVAYQLIVPHAYPSISSKEEVYKKMPLIINVADSYANTKSCHVFQDISESYSIKTEMLLCHESQVLEWLPWSKGETSSTRKTFKKNLLARHMRTNKNYGIVDNISREFFSFTAWGRNVTKEDVNILFDKGTITPNGHKIIEKV